MSLADSPHGLEVYMSLADSPQGLEVYKSLADNHLDLVVYKSLADSPRGLEVGTGLDGIGLRWWDPCRSLVCSRALTLGPVATGGGTSPVAWGRSSVLRRSLALSQQGDTSLVAGLRSHAVTEGGRNSVDCRADSPARRSSWRAVAVAASCGLIRTWVV